MICTLLYLHLDSPPGAIRIAGRHARRDVRSGGSAYFHHNQFGLRFGQHFELQVDFGFGLEFDLEILALRLAGRFAIGFAMRFAMRLQILCACVYLYVDVCGSDRASKCASHGDSRRAFDLQFDLQLDLLIPLAIKLCNSVCDPNCKSINPFAFRIAIRCACRLELPFAR